MTNLCKIKSTFKMNRDYRSVNSTYAVLTSWDVIIDLKKFIINNEKKNQKKKKKVVILKV